MRQLYHQELMRFYMNQIAVLYTMTVKFGSTKCWKESHLKKKIISLEERDDLETENMASKEIQQDGVSVIGGHGLARKETLSTEKTEARNLLLACRVLSSDPRYLSDMLHETQKQPATCLK